MAEARRVAGSADGDGFGRSGRQRPANLIVRFALALALGLAADGIGIALLPLPLVSRLEPQSIAGLTGSVLFGPAGALAVAVAALIGTLLEGRAVAVALIHAGGYLVLGMIAYAVFRFVPRLRRGLDDLRSYAGFVSAVLISSAVLAVIGSANMFLRSGNSRVFLMGVAYWFGSSVTSLLIVAPVILILANWKLRRQMITLPGDTPAIEGEDDSWVVPADRRIAVGAAMIIAITVIVSPLVQLRPQFGGWLALLYLIPILWASSRGGLRDGVLAASASGIAHLAGGALWGVVLQRELTHDLMMGQFVGLVIFALIGAITGAFQQARNRAERALLRSKQELERRHEALEAVARLGDSLQRPLDEEAIAVEAVDTLIRLSQKPSVAVYLLDQGAACLRLVAHGRFDPSTAAAGATLPLEGSLSGDAIRTRELCWSENIAADHKIAESVRALLLRDGIRAAISVPLVFEAHALGAINLVYREPGAFIDEDREVLRTIGRTVALAIVNARHVARLEHLAFHDPLTGLPNREGFQRDFSRLAGAGNARDGRLGLVLVDIDRFKEVNDALGHLVGDKLLAAMGPRIKAAVADRSPSVSRLSGNAFAILLPELRSDADAQGTARELLAALGEPYAIDGLVLEVGASAGIAVYPDNAGDGSELLRCADAAVHHAKSTSQRIVTYSAELDLHTTERLALASELGRAIRDHQLLLHYQPKVTLADGRPIGFEALVRWQHPQLGLLPPDRFVPLAEVGEQIHPLTYWVLENSLVTLARWQRRHPELTMAINLSARNLLDRSCASQLRKIIDDAGIDPRTVEFELTETALLIDPDNATITLQRIAASGARVVIDDFGTGYSSMAFLKRCPIHALKIDRSFVQDVLRDPQSRAIVRATVQLAHDLELAVVAEGIESAAIVTALAEMGCSLGQGDFFLKASPAQDLDRQLAL